VRDLGSVVLLVLVLLAPSATSATQITLTYDTGQHDDTIVGPGGQFHGPFDWLESGARIAGFWALEVGTPTGRYEQGHVHTGVDSGNPTGIAGSTHAWTGDLQGIEVSLEGGGTFDLISIDYDVRALDSFDPAAQRLPWSYPTSDPQLLATRDFDPSVSDFESQWTGFAAQDDANWRTHDWYTMSFTGAGFENLTSVMIAQSASFTWFDNVVIDVHALTTAPEPGTAILVALGLLGLALFGRIARASR
jgi:hypothetical protein